MDKGQLEDRGQLYSVDSEGYLINSASLASIPQHWRPLLGEVIEAYRQHRQGELHSLYVRGSVVRGEAVDGVSDLDTMAIYTSPWTNPGGFLRVEPWMPPVGERLVSRYGFCTDVELCAVTLDGVFSPRGTFCRFMLKTACVSVYGESLLPRLPKVRPDRGGWIQLWNLTSDVDDTLRACEQGDEDIEGWCRWMCKGLVRAGLELCMLREPVYTRDLMPCWQVFSRHYPAYAEQMRTLLTLAIWPTTSPATLSAALALPVVGMLTEQAAAQGTPPWGEA